MTNEEKARELVKNTKHRVTELPIVNLKRTNQHLKQWSGRTRNTQKKRNN